MANPNPDIDYRNVDYPTGEPREEWSYQARRAYLLERIEEAGHPDFINQSEVAREFDKSHSTIHRDIRRLQEYVTEEVDEQRLDHIGITLYESAIKDEIADENWGAADRLFQNWTEWLDTRGLADYLPDDDDEDAPETVGEINMEIAGVSDMDLSDSDDQEDGEDDEDDDQEAGQEAAPEVET